MAMAVVLEALLWPSQVGGIIPPLQYGFSRQQENVMIMSAVKLLLSSQQGGSKDQMECFHPEQFFGSRYSSTTPPLPAHDDIYSGAYAKADPYEVAATRPDIVEMITLKGK